VHAFNVLRAAFQDKELSTETTSFAARGLEVSIRAFSSPHWEVRGEIGVKGVGSRVVLVKFRNLKEHGEIQRCDWLENVRFCMCPV